MSPIYSKPTNKSVSTKPPVEVSPNSITFHNTEIQECSITYSDSYLLGIPVSEWPEELRKVITAGMINRAKSSLFPKEELLFLCKRDAALCSNFIYKL